VGKAYIVGVGAGVGFLVDVDLDDHGPEHGGCAKEETKGDALDGGEAVASAAEELEGKGMSVGCRSVVMRKNATYGVQDKVADWDEDDQSEGVEVVEDVVGDAVESHDGCLAGEVVVELVVADPVKL